MSITEPDREEMEEITEEMLRAITSPEFIEQFNAVLEADAENRVQAASEHLNPDALREAGVDLPHDMRISSRYFEEGFDQPLEVGDIEQGPVIKSLNEVRPGLLDELRRDEPEVYRRLTGTSHGFSGERLAVSGCCGAGKLSACGCCGGGKSRL